MRDQYRKSVSIMGASSLDEVVKFTFDVGKITEEQYSPSPNSTATPNTKIGRMFKSQMSPDTEAHDYVDMLPSGNHSENEMLERSCSETEEEVSP